MNPFTTAATGTVSIGERLHLTIQPPGSRAIAFRPWVTAVEQHHCLEWLGRLALPGVFDGRHSFTLTPMTRGRTLDPVDGDLRRRPDPLHRIHDHPHTSRIRLGQSTRTHLAAVPIRVPIGRPLKRCSVSPPPGC